MRMLYFAWIRETVGVAEEELDLPGAIVTVNDLIAWLKSRSPGHAMALADPDMLRAALDQEHAPLSAPLGDAREVALFPPMTGG